MPAKLPTPPRITARALRQRAVKSIPMVLFFLILFYCVFFFFDKRFAMIVPFISVLFEFNHRRYLSPLSLVRLVGVALVMCLCSFLAGQNLILCVALNLTVPFLLVYLQTTQFQQKGYFANAMGFVFLQLDPVGWDGFLPFLQVCLFSLAVLVGGLLIFSRGIHSAPDYRTVQQGLSHLSRALDLLAHGQRADPQLNRDLLEVQAALHKLCHGRRGLVHVAREEGRIYYMFALLCQRGAYFIADYGAEVTLSPRDITLLCRMSALLGDLSQNLNPRDNQAALADAQALLKDLGGGYAPLRVFLRNCLTLLISTLQEMAAPTPAHTWRLPRQAHPLLGLRRRLRLDRFEVRFALRLSILLTATFFFCRYTNIDHAYWLPLNAFILLQPMYEDSTYRAKTRLVGTLIGCALCYLVLPRLPGLPAYMVFFSLLICGIQCATPGTWIHPIFTTSFSLSMASLTMSHATAIGLRITYLLAATALVLLANRRFFPTSLPGQFRENVKELFHIQAAYLLLLADSTRQAVDYGSISTALTHFHLVRDQVRGYLNQKIEPLDQAFYDKLLNLMWRMAAEIELMIFLLRSQDSTPEDGQLVRTFALDARQQLEHLVSGTPAPKPLSAPSIQDSYLAHLAGQYLSHLTALERLTAGRPAPAQEEEAWVCP